MTRVRWAALVLLLGAVAGCAERQAGADGAGKTCTETKDSGGLTVVLAYTPCPIKGGQSASGHITVKDSSGAVVKDATVKLAPEMPSMNMHSGEQTATPNGDGYDSKIVLGMGGDWSVKVVVTRGSAAPAEVSYTLSAK
ncbi:MAG TPA: FixH family protein [Umezawaea sp.]|nr:FixH family protein [Umezawaea sp.]